MSDLSVLLKKVISFLALNEQDRATLHADIDAVVPTVAGVALGLATPAEGIASVVLPLIKDVAQASEARLVDYVESRLAGKSPVASISDKPLIPAGIDTSLVAPSVPTASDLSPVLSQGELSAPQGAPPTPSQPVAVATAAGDPLATVTAPVVAIVDALDGPKQVVTQEAVVPSQFASAQPTPVAIVATPDAASEQTPATADVNEVANPASNRTSSVSDIFTNAEPPLVVNEGAPPAPDAAAAEVALWKADGFKFNPLTGEPL